MTIHAMLTDGPLVQRLGRTLAHTVWQGLAAAAVLRLSFAVVRRSARARYALACTALVSMAVAAAATFELTGDAAPAGVATAAVPTSINLPGPAVATVPHIVSTTTMLDRRSLTALIVLVWASGVAGQVVWQVIGWTRVRQLARGPAVGDGRWTAAMATSADRVGVRRAVRLLGSARVDVPVVLGVLRPAIVVPLSLLADLPTDHVEAILAHELAHVRRHDYLANLIQCGVEAVFFYHPAVWWMSAVVRREREHCCDDVAAGVVGNRATYAATLLTLEACRGPSPRLAMAVTDGSLAGRVRRLVDVHPRRTAGPSAAVLAAAVVLSVGAATWVRTATPARAQSRPPTTSAATAPAPSSADQVLAILTREQAQAFADYMAARETKGAAHPDVVRLQRRLDDINSRIGQVRERGSTHGAVAPVPEVTAPSGPVALHIHVTIGRDGFIAVDGGVGDWVTVRDRLARLPAAARAAAVVDLVAESDDVPVRDLFRAEADLGRAMTEAGGGHLEVGAIEPGPVAIDGEAYIGGHVQRPGVYSVSHRRITVKQLVVSAGGTNDGDDGDRVTIYRRSAGGRAAVANVRLADILSGSMPDAYLQPYDVVMVLTADPATRPAAHAATAAAAAAGPSVSILGDVKRPGQYLLLPGRAKTLGDVMRWAGGTNDGTDRAFMLIRQVGTSRQPTHFDSVNAVMSGKGDVPLQPGDLLLVPKAGPDPFKSDGSH